MINLKNRQLWKNTLKLERELYVLKYRMESKRENIEQQTQIISRNKKTPSCQIAQTDFVQRWKGDRPPCSLACSYGIRIVILQQAVAYTTTGRDEGAEPSLLMDRIIIRPEFKTDHSVILGKFSEFAYKQINERLILYCTHATHLEIRESEIRAKFEIEWTCLIFSKKLKVTL